MRSWIFRRDPDFREKAGRVLDLYQRRWEGRLLHPGEFVISADEKSQLQALGRRPTDPRPGPGHPLRHEFEHRRGGRLAYLAAWDVHHARLFDRVEPKTGIEPFGRLVEQVMTEEPYASAKAVFWVVDKRLLARRAGLRRAPRRPVEEPAPRPPARPRLVAEPGRALLLDHPAQGLTPNDCGSLEELAERLLAFGRRYREVARPFEWTFNRSDLDRVLDRVDSARALEGERDPPRLRLAA